jgi:thiamine biosynthesis protein ThiS
MGEDCMITITFNNEAMTINENDTLAIVLKQRQLTTNHFAVAINRRFVARPLYAETKLQHHDIVDIILPMQGG